MEQVGYYWSTYEAVSTMLSKSLSWKSYWSRWRHDSMPSSESLEVWQTILQLEYLFFLHDCTVSCARIFSSRQRWTSSLKYEESDPSLPNPGYAQTSAWDAVTDRTTGFTHPQTTQALSQSLTHTGLCTGAPCQCCLALTDRS